MKSYWISQIQNDNSLQNHIKELIFSKIREVGFELYGVAKLEENRTTYLQEWVSKNYNADMNWFSRTVPIRVDIKKWFPEIVSVIVVGKYYYHKCNNSYIALYAHGVDYHIEMKTKLDRISSFIKDIIADAKCKISVDTSPVSEKYWARKAGLGWQGKNTLIINPEYGSWFNIGILAVNFLLPPDVELENSCGNCTKCIDSCPTKALLLPGILDARKCISYHTIENKGNIPPEIMLANKNYIFGCDLCQIVCPWNKVKKISNKNNICEDKIYQAIMELIKCGKITDFSVFRHSSIKRLGLKLLLRNASMLKLFQQMDCDN